MEGVATLGRCVVVKRNAIVPARISCWLVRLLMSVASWLSMVCCLHATPTTVQRHAICFVTLTAFVNHASRFKFHTFAVRGLCRACCCLLLSLLFPLLPIIVRVVLQAIKRQQQYVMQLKVEHGM
jgi:hypothetical protein